MFLWIARRYALTLVRSVPPRVAQTKRPWAGLGGFGSKIHAIADGPAADSAQAIPLMDGLSPQACLADKGYDSDALLAWLQEKGIKAVIPPKSNRNVQRDCDYGHYQERHAVECLFGHLKYFRRIALHYEKKAINFMEMLAFAATLLWLR